MSCEILNMEQGKAEWFEARMGLVTASHFKEVISKGAGRKTYMMQLLAERLLNKVTEIKDTPDMQRGRELEPRARIAYQLTAHEIGSGDVEQAGIILNHGVGFSPDGLWKEDGTIEIKCPRPHNHLEYLTSDKCPSKYVGQVQGGLWVSEREWCDFVSYCPPLPLFVKRVFRDEKKIKQISDACEIFNAELNVMESKIKAMSD